MDHGILSNQIMVNFPIGDFGYGGKMAKILKFF
jgi:hypothetical protein